MLTYELSQTKQALYKQLYEYLKEDIVSGKLPRGAKLPSKRNLAEHHGISTITVQKAYDQLVSEGYLVSKPRSGYLVANVPFTYYENAKSQSRIDIKAPGQASAASVNLSNNHTNPQLFPFSVWTKLARFVMAEKTEELMKASPTGGVYELRAAIATHLQSFRGMQVDPNQIIVGAGTEYLYSLLVQLLGRNRVYCTENPGYQKLNSIYKQQATTCCQVDIDEQGMNPAALAKTQASVVHMSPGHHFPTGITMPASRRYELLAWANKQDSRYIIEDDYDSEFRLNGRPVPTLYSMDSCEKVIYLNTFSKTLTPTIRISYMVLPVHLAHLFYENLAFYACTVSNFEQYTLAEFIAQGYFEKHLNRTRLYYGRLRKAILSMLEELPLKDFCELEESDSGLHFMLCLKTELTDACIKEQMSKRGIEISMLSDYYEKKLSRPDDSIPKTAQHRVLVNYSNLNLEQVKQAFEVLQECLQ